MIRLFLFHFFLVPMLLLSKYEISLRLDKILLESNLKNEMQSKDGRTFTDSWMTILWIPTPSGFAFELTNKTDASISVIWDESAFINEQKVTSKVIHEGTPLLKKDQPIPPSTIPIMAKLRSSVIPEDYFTLDESTSSKDPKKDPEWKMTYIWANEVSDELYAKILKDNPVFRVVLALKKGQEIRRYHFFFAVAGKRK